MFPPSFIICRINRSGHSGFGIWIPFILLWPVMLLLVLLVLPLVLVAEVALRVAGRPVPLCGMLAGIVSVLGALKGTRMHVNGRNSNETVAITII